MKSPHRWKASQVILKRRRSHVGDDVGLGCLPTLGPRCHLGDEERAVRNGREGGRSSGAKGGRRQGCQRLDRIVHRGKTTPTLVNGSREADVTGQSVYGDRSAKADLDDVKRLVPRSSHAEPKLSGTSTR